MNKIFVLSLIAILMLSSIVTFFSTLASSATEDSWVSKAPIPSDLNRVKAAVAYGKIYVISGSYNYEYDPATNNWTAKKPLPTPMYPSFGIASCNNKIYVIGGGGTDQKTEAPYYFATNEVYDPLTDTWEIKAPMPTARDWVQADAINGKIYVIGGVHDEGYSRFVSTSVNEVYDPATDSWTTKQPAPIAVMEGPSTVVDSRIYLIGGAGGGNGTSNQIYDTETDSWSFGASIPTPIGYAAAGATTGAMAPKRIYIISGQFTKDTKVGDDYKITSTINVFNPELNSWSTVSSSISRVDNTMVVVNDTLYAIGGASSWHEDARYTGFIALTLTNRVDQYFPLGYGTIQPVVHILLPQNESFYETIVHLTFIDDKPATWLGYSLDGQDNVTIAGNVSLAGLVNGLHNVTVYAQGENGNIGASETVVFTVAKLEHESFLVTIVAVALGVSAAVVGIGLFWYFKKHKN